MLNAGFESDSRRRASSGAPLRGATEQPLGPQQQDRKQESEGDGVAHGRADVGDRKHLGKAEKKTAEQSAANIAHAAEDHHRNAFMQHRLSHAGIDGITVKRDQYPGNAAEQRSDQRGGAK